MNFYVSDDGGSNWRVRSTPLLHDEPGTGASLVPVSPTMAYALGSVGLEIDDPNIAPYHHIGVTRDSGATWSYLADPCRVTDIEVLAATSERDLWLVCGGQPATAMEAKEVYRSCDGGAHWTLRAATIVGGHDVGGIPASGHVDRLVAVSATRAYLGLSRSTQFQTIDGGRTWTNSFPVGGDVGGLPINFVDPTHGWGTGEFHLYRTVDGVHWADLGGGRP